MSPLNPAFGREAGETLPRREIFHKRISWKTFALFDGGSPEAMDPLGESSETPGATVSRTGASLESDGQKDRDTNAPEASNLSGTADPVLEFLQGKSSSFPPHCRTAQQA